MKFKEYSVILEDESLCNSEIMLCINKEGKIIRTYGYLDNIPEFYNYNSFDRHRQPKRVNFPYRPSELNKLFVNFRINQIVKYLSHIYFCEADIENFENDKDDILKLAVDNYKHLQIV